MFMLFGLPSPLYLNLSAHCFFHKPERASVLLLYLHTRGWIDTNVFEKHSCMYKTYGTAAAGFFSFFFLFFGPFFA